jgi:hypothetical protein
VRIDEPSVTIFQPGHDWVGITGTGQERPALRAAWWRSCQPLRHRAIGRQPHTPDGRVAVEGFYGDVEAISAERAAVQVCRSCKAVSGTRWRDGLFGNGVYDAGTSVDCPRLD